ncbi:MAG: hypothetical protein JSU86_12415 [Phycisphaerales bacterium]|nr:MAG: hypothetical protein JSU86_12415 [Phycisphaerales bacterium]
MRSVTILCALSVGVVAFSFLSGCKKQDKPGTPAGDVQGQPSRQAPEQPATPPARRVAFTAENNPTTLAGRGEPSLDDFFRLPAWIYLDGKEGKFIERDGKPQVQWFIEGAVGSSPTFRVEAYEALLGTPKDFTCQLDTVDSPEASAIAYSFQANPGAFRVGHEYSLLKPGNDFTIRNRESGDVVAEIPPLVPGTYVLWAGIKNLEAGKEGLAITYFTVAEDAGQ